MVLQQSSLFSFASFFPNTPCSSNQTLPSKISPIYASMRSNLSPILNNSKHSKKTQIERLCTGSGLCSCGRRPFLEATVTGFFPIRSSRASNLQSESMGILNRVHPPRPDWYEEFYAWLSNTSTKAYEAEVSGYKSQLFSELRGKAKEVLEIGIGTGPNLKYYANDSDVHVFGIDPNRKMEKYAQTAAVAAGLPLSNFKFIHAVGEGIPLGDASVDAVVGTLVLCSVKDVDATLKEVQRVLRPGGRYVFVEHVAAKDGTILRFIQRVLDPLQQSVADGCHLTRETGKYISEAGFSGVDLSAVSVRNASIVSPHVYGIGYK